MDFDKSLFLTFDIDWASDEVIQDTIDILKENEVNATFFVTHESDLINKLKSDLSIELGIHPNFNPLLSGINSQNMEEIVEWSRKLLPNAVSFRSHSLVQSSRLINLIQGNGYFYDLNMFIPFWSNMVCLPYKEVNDIIRLPYFWEDDVHAYAIDQQVEKDWRVQRYLERSGLKIFDFHPIHIFLNTDNLKRYSKVRNHLEDTKMLIKHRNMDSSNGTRSFFIKLIKAAKKQGFKFYKISDIKL